jgi:hypothetical protein
MNAVNGQRKRLSFFVVIDQYAAIYDRQRLTWDGLESTTTTMRPFFLKISFFLKIDAIAEIVIFMSNIVRCRGGILSLFCFEKVK